MSKLSHNMIHAMHDIQRLRHSNQRTNDSMFFHILPLISLKLEINALTNSTLHRERTKKVKKETFNLVSFTIPQNEPIAIKIF